MANPPPIFSAVDTIARSAGGASLFALGIVTEAVLIALLGA